jgi:glycerol-3-phosphate dehydrogenase
MILTWWHRNKNRLNRLADGFGAALGKHAEWRKPALAKTLPMPTSPQPELGTRESLLTPANTSQQQQQQHQQRIRSQSAASEVSIATSSASGSRTPERKSLADVEARYREESEMVRQAQEAVMQRPNFAIDAIGDSDGEDEDEEEGGDDGGVMDEVS